MAQGTFSGLLKRPKCQNFFPVPNIVETPMETIPQLVMYLFNQGILDFVFKMC